MEFIGITAFIDAVIAIVAWGILHSRKSKMDPVSQQVRTLGSYLIITFVFLTLISLTILKTTGNTQAVMFIISDLVLWVSLVLFIKLMFVGSNSVYKNTALWIFYILAAMRTLWQVAGLMAIDLSFLGGSMLKALSQLDAWLMYLVWIPSAIYFIWLALSTDNPVVRSRSLMFGIGLLLITFTWAFRLLGQGKLDEDTSYLLVSGASVVGFLFLLGGVFYRSATKTMQNA
ncbi:MAG: hypothetical protein M3P22_02935 [bacterium]|nr:hypothetical protein [bacterium]